MIQREKQKRREKETEKNTKRYDKRVKQLKIILRFHFSSIQ